MNGLSLRAVNNIPVVLNEDKTAYHIPSFLPSLIDEASTLSNAEFARLMRDEIITWRPMPLNARLAAASTAVM